MLAALLLAQLVEAAPAPPPEPSVTPTPPPESEAPLAAVLRRPPASAPSRRFPFEVTAQITAGGGGFFGGPTLVEPVFALGVRLDFLLLRRSHWAIGLGPFASLRSDNFSDLSPAAGVSMLLPLHEAFPLVLSIGAAGRWSVTGFDGGLTQRAFWGLRSLNLHQAYALALGFFVESRQFFARDGGGGLSGADVVAGIDIDLQSVVIPWMALYSWLFRSDTAR